MEEARSQDHSRLSEQLNELSQNDHRILSALEDRHGQYRRMEELLIGLTKVSRPWSTFFGISSQIDSRP